MKRFKLKDVRYVIKLSAQTYMGRINLRSSGVRTFAVVYSEMYAKRYNLVAAQRALKVAARSWCNPVIVRVVRDGYGNYVEATE